MEGTCEQTEYKKNPKTNLMLLAKRTSNEETGGKYETVTGHLAQHLTIRRKGKAT
jgi:hypothetical protein